MKKLILTMALNVATLSGSAQVVKVALKPTENGNTPTVVLDSIKKSFPEPISQTLTKITAQNYGKQWNVEISPASEQQDPLYYEVDIINTEGRYKAIYNSKGNLMRLKQTLKKDFLPDPVNQTIQARYNGWSLVDKEERIDNNGRRVDTEYKVLLKKGIIKKAVYLDESGKVKLALPAV